MDYQDFSAATPWERLSAHIEQHLLRWMAPGPQSALSEDASSQQQQVATLEHQLQCRNEPYILTLHQPCDKKQDSILPAGSQQLHKLQQWFGISTFVLIAPATYSGRILDQQEAATLLSALAAALSSCHCAWPGFVPVHDPRRDGCTGVAAAGRGTVHYEADSVYRSRMPQHVLQVQGQLAIFASRLRPRDPEAAGACTAAASASAADAQQEVTVSVRQCFSLPQPLLRWR